MFPRHPRFVTACQQLLVLGVICAALTPAANIVSLELVPRGPDGAPVGTVGTGSASDAALPELSMAAYSRASTLKAQVPSTEVDVEVEEYPLTAPAGARIAPDALAATSRRTTPGSELLVSEPTPVTGFGTVGVTWADDPAGDELGEEDIAVQVRTKDGGAWSGWTDAEYHDEHGPDPDSPEAIGARQGVDEVLVGAVDEVQVRVGTRGSAPADLKLAVIDPGVPVATDEESPAIDTGTLPGEGATPATPASLERGTTGGDAAAAEAGAGEDGLALAAATSVTPKPQIFSRKQWGADESLRSPSSLSYFEVHAGFVHHTVSANGYARKDVPAILRGIYAYHTQARGWSDVGYNFLVDRFGRVWEGRAGGVDRPVVGAHTLGYNERSFAMSAIGNFETAQPSQAMVQAYGAVFAWKLALHGVRAGSQKQQVGSATFPAINGHRDAGATACPGKFLYAKLPQIRSLAKQTQVGFAGRQLQSNVRGRPQPDILVRRASDGRAMLIPIVKTSNGYKAGKARGLAINLDNASRIMSAGDWNRDGHSDIITRRKSDGRLFLRLGLGNGTFQKVRPLAEGFGGVKLLAAVGDMTGDGFPDLMGQPNKGRPMMIWPGRGGKGLGAPFVASSRIKGSKQVAVGRWDRNGAPDTLVRRGPTLTMYAGNGPGGFTGSRVLPIDVSPYDWVVGVSNVDGKGHPDLVVRAKGTGQLLLIRAKPSSFGQPIPLGGGFGAYNMVE